MKYALIPALFAVSLSAFAKEETYTIDASHTYPSFSLDHMGFSTMRGVFDESSGSLTLDSAAKSGKVDITIATASIDTGHGKRDDHLRGEEFFNVAKFPTMVFKSDKFTFDGDKLSKVDGELTLLGVTKPVSLKVERFYCGQNKMIMKQVCGAELTGAIKRSDFGMKAYVPNVGDEVQLAIEVEAVRDAETAPKHK